MSKFGGQEGNFNGVGLEQLHVYRRGLCPAVDIDKLTIFMIGMLQVYKELHVTDRIFADSVNSFKK